MTVQRIHGDQKPGEIDRIEQIDQLGNLASLRIDFNLSGDQPGVVVECGQQIGQVR